MKVGLVSEATGPSSDAGGDDSGVDAGGRNVQVAELATALTRRGNEVTVYTRRSEAGTAEVTHARGGYHVVRVPAGPEEPVAEDEMLPHMAEFAQSLGHRLALHRPDVVHPHCWMSGLAAQHACRGSAIPVTQTFHALGVTEGRDHRAERIKLERVLAREADLVLASCSDEMAELAGLGAPRANIAVVPRGVNLEQFSPTVPAAGKTAAHRLVAVGRLVPRKGFDTTIAALPSLPETELLIAGGPAPALLDSDEEADRLRSYARELGVAERVRLLGCLPRSDIPALLRSADAVVCSPRHEPFGMVALEAMACGAPVIATAVGGLVDTVVDGVTGLHVRPGAPRALARAVGELLSRPELASGYGVAGHDRARSRYSWDRVAADTERAYARAAERRRQHAAPREHART